MRVLARLQSEDGGAVQVHQGGPTRDLELSGQGFKHALGRYFDGGFPLA